jgi:predicted MFS family arabinose efflux permease
MSLHIVVHDEFLPIFLAYDVAKTETGELVSKFPLKLTGGLGFTSQDTGQLLSSTGVLGIFFILIVFPYVDRKYDCLTTYKMFIWIFPVIYLLVPYDVFLANYSKFTAKCVIYVMTSLKALGTSISFPQMLLIVHNSADPKHRALINGAAISVSALARFVGPLLWGFIMSWGQLYNIAWIGWWSLSLLGLLAIQQSQYLRDSAVENEQAEDAEHEE